MVVKIAARQSDLARLQAFEVGRSLTAAANTKGQKIEIDYTFRTSLGDQRADDPLWKMPEKGVFTEDFVADILSGAVDLVVHSWKDLPIIDRAGTKITATLPRADARDVLLVRRDLWQRRLSSASPAAGAGTEAVQNFRILTSSPRRVYNLEPFLKTSLPWPNAMAAAIEFVPVRGNIATRVGKLVNPSAEVAYDGLVVAKAALDRLLTSGVFGPPFIESAAALRAALAAVNFVVLPLSVNPAAAAQGALAIEVRSDRKDLIELCALVDATADRECVEAERRELARHGGGCHQKIGVTVLKRPYGKIEFIRGLTDAGLVLNSMALARGSAPQSEWPKPSRPEEIFTGDTHGAASAALTKRSAIQHGDPAQIKVSDAKATRGYFVARAEAWPTELKVSDYVWTAGLSTWRKLASQGVWVHGSSEGLGEDEDTRIEILAGRPVEWLRMTHEDAVDLPHAPRSGKAVATYKIESGSPDVRKLKEARYFYWRSGSQFKSALNSCPEIATGFHATGPGHTHAIVRAALAKAGVSDEQLQSRLAIFLNETEFTQSLNI